MSVGSTEETQKAIKLISAIVIVFGFGAWRVAAAVSPAPAPAQDAAPATEVPAAVSSGATPAEAKSSDEAIKMPKMFVASSINPFRTIAAPEAHLATSGGGAVEPLPTLSGAPIGPLPVAVPGDLSGTVPGGAVGAPINPSVSSGAVRPTLRVEGIMAGPGATAILDVGNDTQVVHTGSRLSDGTVILRIEASKVIVQRGKEKQRLSIADY